MKRNANHLAVTLGILFAGQPALPAQQPGLTLKEAVGRALQNNPELAIDAPARGAAVSEVAAGRAGYLPRIDFEQSLAGGNNPVFVFGTLLTQRRFGESDFALSALNTPGAVKNVQSRITGQQTIWDFGRTAARVNAAGTSVDLADRMHDEHVSQLLMAVYETYYSASLAASALETADAALQSAESLVQQARARVDSGLAVEADLLRGQVHLSTARHQEVDAAGRLEIARASLNRIMGAPLDSPLGDTVALSPTVLPLPAEEQLLSQQRQRRPDYQRALAEVRRMEFDEQAQKREFLPTLGAWAAWEMDNPSPANYGGSNWTAGISLRWNVFAGGADTARLQAARQRLEQGRLRLAALESSMALELRQAVIQVRSAGQQVETMRGAEAQSLESLRILRNRYEAGLATMTDLLAAQTAYAASRTALAESVYRYRISYARLEFAAGILSPTSPAMSH